MRSSYPTATLAFSLVILGTACSFATPPPPDSVLPAETTMIAELTDLAAPVSSDGTLSFTETSEGSVSIALWLGAGVVGFGSDLSLERTADLVAGRLVESTGLGDGVLPPVQFRRDGVDANRQVTSIQLSLQGESGVLFNAELGAADRAGVPAADLSGTGRLTVRGQLRLNCTVQPEPGGLSTRLDPAFSSPFCARLRTELALDPLLAISSSI
jgi:hypothetical protein